MTFVASVNFGFTGPLIGIPFITVVLVMLSSNQKFRIQGIVILFLCFSLYFMKSFGGPIFHPAVSKKLVLSQDACILNFGERVLIARTSKHPNCNYSHTDSIEKPLMIPKGTQFKGESVQVTNPDFSERYSLKASSEFGHIIISERDIYLLAWPDGTSLSQADLIRPIFSYPTKILYIPFLILILILKIF